MEGAELGVLNKCSVADWADSTCTISDIKRFVGFPVPHLDAAGALLEWT